MTLTIICGLTILAGLIVTKGRIMTAIQGLRAAIVAEIRQVRDAVASAGADLAAKLAQAERDRDTALALAEDASARELAERAARVAAEAALDEYRAGIEDLTAEITADGTFGDQTDPEPEPDEDAGLAEDDSDEEDSE